MVSDNEAMYLDGLVEVLTRGDQYVLDERTESARLSVTGSKHTYDIGDNVPFLTTKHVKPGLVVPELIWFMRGDTNIQYLEENGVGIWTANAFQNYLETTGQEDEFEQYSDEWNRRKDAFANRIRNDDDFAREHGDLGPVYGKVWRDFPNPDGDNIDQLGSHVEDIRRGRQSTRHLINAWHPVYLDDVALPPCHYSFQLHNRGDKLDITLSQRSTDSFLGEPFNIASYGLLTKIIAEDAGLEPGKLHHFHGNKPLYCGTGERKQWYADNENREWLRHSVEDVMNGGSREEFHSLKSVLEKRVPPEDDYTKRSDHIPLVLEQLGRQGYEPPEVTLSAKRFDDYGVEEVSINDYNHCSHIRGRMAV